MGGGGVEWEKAKMMILEEGRGEDQVMSGWGKGVAVGVSLQHFSALWSHKDKDSESGWGEIGVVDG